MILNDIADFSEDSRDRTFRPLPSGRLSRKFAHYGSMLLLAMALMLAFSINESLALAVFVLIILIFSYNFLTKERCFGPINMGLIRMTNWLLVMIAMQNFDFRMLLAASLIFLYTIIVTLISRFETIDFSNKVRPLLLTLVVFMLVLSIFMVSQIDSSLSSLVLFVFIGWLFWVLFRFSPTTSQDTQQFVTLLLKSMVILDGVILISFNYLWLGVFCSMFFLLSSKLAKYVYMT
jgi:4-hydroxybenzoate polyprenyltransferase